MTDTLILSERGSFNILEDRIIAREGVFGALVDLTGVKGLSFDTGFGGQCDRGLDNLVLVEASGWSFFSISQAQIDEGDIVGDLTPGRYASFVVERALNKADPYDDEEDERVKVVVKIDEETGVQFLRSFIQTLEKELKAIEGGTPGHYQ